MRAKKSLGQHFIQDEWAQRIVFYINPQPNELLIEVGPGLGAMTQHLVRVAQVIAVEKDDLLSKKLQFPHLQVWNEDILTISLEKITRPYPLRLVSNLPYYITSLFLLRFLPLSSYYSELILVVQKEIAERIMAPPHSSLRGSFSLFAQAYAEAELLCLIPRSAFTPVPKVDSACLRLRLHPYEPPQGLFSFIQKGFRSKRKQLVNALAVEYPKEAVRHILEQQHWDVKIRAEALTLQQWEQLFYAFK